jgi:hypothetical protein
MAEELDYFYSISSVCLLELTEEEVFDAMYFSYSTSSASSFKD